MMTTTAAATRGPNQTASLDSTNAHSPAGQQSSSQSSTSLTDVQNHHMRSSPPIQPGEQAFPGKLPSFSEFLHTTRTTTPPRTPQRRNGSTDSSPHAPPHFDEIAWADSKRRRVDTLGDIYARGSIDQSFAEPRRMSAIDPALSGYQHAAPPVPSVYSHRPSPSYPPPHQQAPPMHPHVRHQSSPAPQGHIPFAQPSAHAPIAQSAYQPPMGQQSYYHDHQAPAYSSYDRPQDSFYPRPAYSGYDAPYGDIRFQHNVGLDHNAFNRKRRGNLPKEATNLLKDWFAANRQSPYPTEDQKMELCNRTGLSLNQVSNWFINARRRAPQKEQREREANGPEA
ncbi:uncharacterized protein SETTUDRAFT_20039 [Exserohilum turcica Et28A]|uniref:Homeobox domain-containing protein n=1 Tax=Exserohilum turcicum (strain 28A) TaxID=671987 RepID=R0K851_EXST2|nr:uncharacterized protein SETTUDRAFT_20039 [Exserohilum turcica Et28A]EOA84502.1 hypothetical protein SETTUDRAFT_20039 [Exserohilum turcica Et28A]